MVLEREIAIRTIFQLCPSQQSVDEGYCPLSSFLFEIKGYVLQYDGRKLNRNSRTRPQIAKSTRCARRQNSEHVHVYEAFAFDSSDRLKQKADQKFVAHRDDLHLLFERVLLVHEARDDQGDAVDCSACELACKSGLSGICIQKLIR